MRIERMVVDLDDVLNNNVLDIMRFKGCEMSSYDDYPNEDVCVRRAVAEYKGQSVQPVKPFWDEIPRQLWSDAEPSEQCFELLEWCRRKADHEGVLIATTPTKCPECMAGKHEWIEKYIPKWLQRSYAVTPRKWWLRRPDTLLIDDQESNCRRFESGPYPGYAIRAPRPWNFNRNRDVMETIKTQHAMLQI